MTFQTAPDMTPSLTRQRPFAVHAAALCLVLLAASALPAAHAQTAEPAAAAPATPPASEPASAASAAGTPKYSAADLDRAFSFMDGNRDGKVSRDEASNFRGVSRHFDQADTNKDGFLSREEFEAGMNKAK